MALTQQKREINTVSYDSQQGKYCLTTGKDQTMILYEIDNYYKQAKVLGSMQIATLSDTTFSALCVVEKFSK